MSEEIIQSSETVSTATSVPAERSAVFPLPTRRVSPGFLVRLLLGNTGWMIVNISLLTLLLPTEIGQLDSPHKVALLGTVLALGGLMGVITPPLGGALSDRTTSRLGRRRPWMLGGMLGVVGGLLLAALFPSIPALALSWIVVSGAGNLMVATMTFVLPDRVPEQQRGIASALVGLAAPGGQVVGLILVTELLNITRQSLTMAYLALIVFVFVLAGSFLFFYRDDPPLPKGVMPPWRLGAFLKGFWVSPRRHPNFAYAWITRFLVFLALFTVSSFTLYYLSDVIHYALIFPGHTAAEGVTIVTSISTVGMVVTTLLGGLISDRFQRRKPFAMGASLIMGLALLIFALIHTWPAVLVASALQGIGFGTYATVDLALITQVLPSTEKSGQALGVIVIAANIAQFVAPAAGAVIVSLFATNVVAGYSTLFLVAALLTLLATVLVLPIKSVR